MARSRWLAFGSGVAAAAALALAGAAQAQARFSASTDGQEVVDSTSGLHWRRCAEGMRWNGKACEGKLVRYTYGAAKQAAAGAAKGDGKSWRVPTREELSALVDRTAKKKPRIDVQAFPQTPAAPFWASRTGSDDNLNAWLVNFASGKVHGNVGQAKFPLRLVRAGS